MVTLIDKKSSNDGPTKVSQSKVKTWRRCRRAYHNKYVLKLRKKIKSRPLMFGTLIHEMIEADANGDDPFELLDSINLKDQKLFQAEREMYGEIVEDVRCIMTDYFDYWSKSDKSVIYLRKNKRSAEHEFELEIGNDLIVTGKIDAAVKSRAMKWIMEHKSFSRVPNEDDRWKSVQSSIYIRVSSMMGWWTGLEGTLWDYVYSKPPAIPNLLQNGKVSEAKLNSLPSRVKAFLATQGAKPKDYPKLMSYVKENRERYFFRVYTPINERVVEDTWADFVSAAEEIRDFGLIKKDRTVDKHCSWCDYEKLCRGEVLGLDLDYIMEREYEHKTEENEPEVSEVESD